MLIAICGGSRDAQAALLAELRHDSPIPVEVIDVRHGTEEQTRLNQLRREGRGWHLYNYCTVVLGVRSALEEHFVRQQDGYFWHLYGPLSSVYSSALTIQRGDLMVASSPLTATHPAHVHTALEALHQCQRRHRDRAERHRAVLRRADLARPLTPIS